MNNDASVAYDGAIPTLPMTVDKTGFLLDRLGKDCSPLQFLRELTQNALEAIAQVQRLLERSEYLDRGALARFSGAMERHSWFTGSVMQALLGFATQAAG